MYRVKVSEVLNIQVYSGILREFKVNRCMEQEYHL